MIIGVSKCFAFVKFKSVDAATALLQHHTRTRAISFDGQVVDVDYSREREREPGREPGDWTCPQVAFKISQLNLLKPC